MGKIISIGSLRGGTGKSTIINNLAVTLAKNYKVIIIDFDTEGQTLRYLFSDLIKNDYNLNNYLISGKPGSGLIKIYDIIYEIKINGLDFSIIPSTNNFSLAHSTFVGGKEHLIEVKSKFEEILIFLKEKFDFILIDTAPGFDNSMLMALEFSDIFFYILRDRKIEYSSFLDYRVKILEKISNKKMILIINNVFRSNDEINEYLKNNKINHKLIIGTIIINFDENLIRNVFSKDFEEEVKNEINLLNDEKLKSKNLQKGIEKLVDIIMG